MELSGQTKEAAAVFVPVESLRPWAKNPRKNDHVVDALVESIRRFGFGAPIIARLNGEVIAGHTRLKAAQKAGLTEVPVRFLDLDEHEAAALALADNKLTEAAEWDAAGLSGILAELEAASVPIDGLGWSKEELDALLGDGVPELEGDGDEAPEVQEEAVSLLGEVYELGPHRLVCGDSTDPGVVAVALGDDRAGLVFTDPPYGVRFQSGMSEGGTATRFDVLANDDKILDIAPVVWSAMGDDTAAFVWTSHHVYPQWRAQFADSYKGTVIWDKGGGGIGDLAGSYATDFEMALFCVKGRPLLRQSRSGAVWSIGKDAASRYEHPTQKPVALAQKAIDDFAAPGVVVLDLFGGSGSTLIAAATRGRIARVIELDPRYCDVIRRRWTRWARENGIDPGPGALEG